MKGWTKIALVPRNRGRNEKIVHRWTKNTVCARIPGHKPRFLARDGQKLRWCPGIGAGTKKLTTAREKLRWCPGIGAGTKKLSMGSEFCLFRG
ncbi:MAG: hypothetical protein QM296_03865 [Bacillota bacterium]|nr:hypothetical protein [Bacillota bacterium]